MLFALASPVRKGSAPAAIAAVCAGLAANALTPAFPDVGYNLFAPNDRNLPRYEATMPADVLSLFVKEFERINPRAKECDPEARLPWTRLPIHFCFSDIAVSRFPFAPSIGGFKLPSRNLGSTSIRIIAGAPALPNLLLDPGHTWHLDGENPNKTPYAYFVAVPIERGMAGGTLCRQGTFFWERTKTAEWLPEIRCEAVSQEAVGDRLWAFQPSEAQPLSIDFSPSGALHWHMLARQWTIFIACLLTAASLLAVEKSAPGLSGDRRCHDAVRHCSAI